MFFIRRVIYCAIVLFLLKIPIVAAYILCWICVLVLCFTVVEQQWEDHIISRQHIVNEVALYLVLLIALTCALPIAPGVASALGWCIISIVLVTVVFNLGIIAYCTLGHLKRFTKRHRKKFSRSKVQTRPRIASLKKS